MISFNYRFMPLRLLLKRKEPTQLIVYAKNDSGEKSILVKVVGESGISFSKGGLKNVDSKRVELKENEEKQITFEIYPTPRTENKYYTITIQLKEYTKTGLVSEKEIETEIKAE